MRSAIRGAVVAVALVATALLYCQAEKNSPQGPPQGPVVPSAQAPAPMPSQSVLGTAKGTP